MSVPLGLALDAVGASDGAAETRARLNTGFFKLISDVLRSRTVAHPNGPTDTTRAAKPAGHRATRGLAGTIHALRAKGRSCHVCQFRVNVFDLHPVHTPPSALPYPITNQSSLPTPTQTADIQSLKPTISHPPCTHVTKSPHHQKLPPFTYRLPLTPNHQHTRLGRP